MISVVPPDWRFLVIGSNKSVLSMDRSFATRYHQANGKLDLVMLPEPWSINEKEDVYRLLTDVRFFDEYLAGVEWLLKFEADSMLCANSLDSLDDWLEYDWAGAPRHVGDRFAGNGGLTLRRVSMMRKILSFQNRVNDTIPEDEWYGRRLTHIPGSKVATGDMEAHFSVEQAYYEKPLGYHVLGHMPEEIWKDRKRRREILEYCPELSLIVEMKLEVERCPGDDGEGNLIQPEKEGKKELSEEEKKERLAKQKEKEDKLIEAMEEAKARVKGQEGERRKGKSKGKEAADEDEKDDEKEGKENEDEDEREKEQDEEKEKGEGDEADKEKHRGSKEKTESEDEDEKKEPAEDKKEDEKAKGAKHEADNDEDRDSKEGKEGDEEDDDDIGDKKEAKEDEKGDEKKDKESEKLEHNEDAEDVNKDEEEDRMEAANDSEDEVETEERGKGRIKIEQE